MATPSYSVAELQAFEKKILKAIADPNIETWYDEYKRRLRPVNELQDALAQIRNEIAAHPDNAGTAPTRPRVLRLRFRSGY